MTFPRIKPQYSSVEPKILCQSQFFNVRGACRRHYRKGRVRVASRREERKEKKEMLNPSVLD